MTDRTRRIIIRATAIGLQWIALTIALGSLVMRSDQSYSQLIAPHFGAAPVIVGTIVAGFLLGLTIEAPRYLTPLVILMCVVASSFVGVLTYAPVVDGVLMRTTDLDNFVSQRVLIMSLLMVITVVPAAVGGNLLGGYMRKRNEIAPHPEDLEYESDTPWWEQRDQQKAGSGTDAEAGQRPV